jgi:hypothetical protein
MKRRMKDASVIVGALAFFSGAAAGCNLLVGVGDYSIADGGAPDTSTQVPDTGTVTGSDGQGDVVIGDATSADVRDGRADASMDARADAANDHTNASADGEDLVDAGEARDVKPRPEAASPVDAGESDVALSDAEAGPPPPTCGAFVPPTQATFQQLVTTCMMAISCDPFVFPVSLSDCITKDVLRSTGSYACLSTIADCNGWYNCQGDRFSTLDECPGFSSFCDTNNTAFDCVVAYPGLVTNCTKQGGTCVQYTDDFGDSRADCVVVPSCTDVDGGVQCSPNNQAISCINGQGFGLNCTAVDSTCQAGTTVGQSCAPNGNVCSSPGTTSCSDGTTLSTCDVTSQGFTYDCSRAGDTCTTGDAGSGCVAPGCALPSSCVESCDGLNTLTVCVGGAPFTIDCTQYGFTSCGPIALDGGPAGPELGNVYCLP